MDELKVHIRHTMLLATAVEGNSNASFSIGTTPRCREWRNSFPWLLCFTLDLYLTMLSVKQGCIKYHFLSLSYDSTWDWTLVSQIIGKPSIHYANCPVIYMQCSGSLRITKSATEMVKRQKRILEITAQVSLLPAKSETGFESFVQLR